MTADEVDEVERSYEVPDGTILPSLTGLADGWSMGQPSLTELEAVYYDTSDLAITGRGATLRRRTGGDDEGWHLKLPRSGDRRVELRWPLDAEEAGPPPEVLAPVRAWVRDHPVAPLASISTRRLERHLSDEDGTVLATLCDDEVRAERLVGVRHQQAWREWEVELAGPSADVLEVVERRLLEAGAERSSAPAKLVRVVGDLLPETHAADPGALSRTSDVEEVLGVQLRSLRDRLHRHDSRLRAGEEDAVHRMRIAARRARSALRTFAPVLERGQTDRVAEELRWLGQQLAAARDAQVLRERLLSEVEQQPGELVMGRVAGRVRADLRAAEEAGRAQALAVLDSERYFRLLDSLDAVAEAPPVRDGRDGAAAARLPRLLQRDARKVRRAASVVSSTEGEDRDAALHELRKKAKRLRSAAELATPVLGKKSRRLGRRAKRVQQALGRHQDCAVARAELRELGVRAHLAGESAFTYGRLHALQESLAADAEADFERAWERMPSRDLRRWL